MNENLGARRKTVKTGELKIIIEPRRRKEKKGKTEQ